MRIALGLEYDGSAFHGWQVQNHEPRTVQAAVERAVARVADQPVAVVCAGRTDAGVHASAQVVHFDTDASRVERAWIHGVNAHLPTAVCVQWARVVADDFHARFSAFGRAYRYVILSRPVRPTYLAHRVAWDYRRLDATRMAQAGRLLLGEHDFSSFRAASCQARHAVRTLTRIEVARHGPYVILEVEANAFLHHMVRNIAGVLMAIGAGEYEPEWAGEVLAARDRTAASVTASPSGLYLTRVDYPDSFEIPQLSSPLPVW